MPGDVAAALTVWADHIHDPNVRALCQPHVDRLGEDGANLFNRLAGIATRDAARDVIAWREAETDRREIAKLEAEAAADEQTEARRLAMKDATRRRQHVRALAKDHTTRNDALTPTGLTPSLRAYQRLSRAAAAIALQEGERIRTEGRVDLTAGERQVLRGWIGYGDVARGVVDEAQALSLFLTSDQEPGILTPTIATALEDRRIAERNVSLPDDTRDAELGQTADLWREVEAQWAAVATEIETMAPALAELLEAHDGKTDEAAVHLRRVRADLESIRDRRHV